MKASRTLAWPRLGAMAHELAIRPDETERLVSLLQSFGLSAVQLGVPLLEEVIAQRVRIATWPAPPEAASLPIIALGGYRNLVAPDATKREPSIASRQRCLGIAPQCGTTGVPSSTRTY